MPSEEPFQSEQRSLSLAGLQLLIVEADLDTRLLYVHLFEDYGARVWSVASMPEALDLLKTQRPDLLISKICLPNEDGNPMDCKTQQLMTLQGQILAVTITASINRNVGKVLEDASLSKFQDSLTKPMSLYELITIVAELTGRKVYNRKLW